MVKSTGEVFTYLEGAGGYLGVGGQRYVPHVFRKISRENACSWTSALTSLVKQWDGRRKESRCLRCPAQFPSPSQSTLLSSLHNLNDLPSTGNFFHATNKLNSTCCKVCYPLTKGVSTAFPHHAHCIVLSPSRLRYAETA
jgi:hypothetical protein